MPETFLNKAQLAGLTKDARRTEILRAKAFGALSSAVGALSVAVSALLPAEDWTDYTPTLGNWTLGDGTATHQYFRIGNLCFVRDVLTFGSTSTFGGSPTLTLPTATSAPSATLYMDANIGLSITGSLFDLKWRSQNSTGGIFMLKDATGTYAQLGNVTGTTPVAATNGTVLIRNGWYPVA